MPLNELQKASLRQHIHNVNQVVDDNGDPIDPGGGPGGGIPQGGPLTELLDADGFRITNVSAPGHPLDAANVSYVDSAVAGVASAVDSVNGQTGTVVLDAADVQAASAVHASHHQFGGDDAMDLTGMPGAGIPQGGPLTEDLDADNRSIINVPSPSEDTAAVPKNYVDTLIASGVRVQVTDLAPEEFNGSHNSPVVLVPAPDTSSKIIHVLSAFAQKWGGAIRLEAKQFALCYEGMTDDALTVGVTGYDTDADQVFIIPVATSAHSFDPLDVKQKAIVLVMDSADQTKGAVNATVLNNPGSGYAPGDTFHINQDGGSAVGVVDTVDGGGGVATYHLTANGQMYPTGVGNGTTHESGSGDDAFTIDIISITPPDWNWRFKVTYEMFQLND